MTPLTTGPATQEEFIVDALDVDSSQQANAAPEPNTIAMHVLGGGAVGPLPTLDDYDRWGA